MHIRVGGVLSFIEVPHFLEDDLVIGKTPFLRVADLTA